MKKALGIICASGVFVAGIASQAFAADIHERKENQQDRIAAGVKNGSLTARETANLEHKEAKINREDPPGRRGQRRRPHRTREGPGDSPAEPRERRYL